jgi:hypothetical protein
MKVVSYLKTVPGNNNNPQKPEILKKFIQGVNACGDIGFVSNDSSIVADADVAVIQGWVYADTSSPHLKFRKQLIDNQTVVTGDANLFLYHNKNNPHGYIRYSFNGIFPTTGNYCDSKVDPNRWLQISKDTGIHLEEYKKLGSSIVLLLQRNNGWSLKGTPIHQWTTNVVSHLRKYTDRPIIIRTHPGDKRANTYISQLQRLLVQYKNISISRVGTPLEQDLKTAWAVVNHNSSAAVGPIIQGYHCFLTDPNDSQCAEVSNTDFSKIETPLEFNRQQWLERISMFHWKFSELEGGTCWKHMREYI